MKKQLIKYWLILIAAIGFVACNDSVSEKTIKKITRTNYTSLKFDSLVSSKDFKSVIKKLWNSDVKSKGDSMINPADGIYHKVYLSSFSIKNDSKDSVFLEWDTYMKTIPIESTYKFSDLNDSWEKRSIGISEYYIEWRKVQPSKSFTFFHLNGELEDSMMFRYYFKTSQFKDSLMWHDVYYTFKNDSFIIVRQTENEK